MANMLRGGKDNQKKVRKLVTPIDPDKSNNFLNGKRKWRQMHRALPYLASGLSQLEDSNGNWVSIAFILAK
jgi:hypothetical protein